MGPALANTFKCSFENKWLKDYPHGLKPAFYRWCDDRFILLLSLDHAEKLKKYLSFKHFNINFALEKENFHCLSILDMTLFRCH